MKIQKIIVLLILSVIISCTKSADELLELSENNLQNSKVDLAISDLEKLLKKHPDDSLASKAQYKLSSIYLNWKNDPGMGFKQLEVTLKNYDNSVHGKQALDQINAQIKLLNANASVKRDNLIRETREVMDSYKGIGNVYLGGTAMIASDMIIPYLRTFA